MGGRSRHGMGGDCLGESHPEGQDDWVEDHDGLVGGGGDAESIAEIVSESCSNACSYSCHEEQTGNVPYGEQRMDRDDLMEYVFQDDQQMLAYDPYSKRDSSSFM